MNLDIVLTQYLSVCYKISTNIFQWHGVLSNVRDEAFLSRSLVWMPYRSEMSRFTMLKILMWEAQTLITEKIK